MRYFYIIMLFAIFGFNNCLNGQTKIISTGDDWSYYDHSKPLLDDWFINNSINEKWKKGISPLGYGDDFVKTEISYGIDSTNKDITKYFKKNFIINDPYSHLIYKLKIQRDDGIVVYLNGREVYRNNMPSGIITDKTKANGLVFDTANELLVHTKLLSPDDFVSGVNTISASVHQARITSSDCLFNIELEGSNDSEMIPLLLKEQAIKNLNLDHKLKELEYTQDLEKLTLKSEHTEQTKNIFKTIGITLLIVLLVLSFLFYNFWKNTNRKEKALTEKISKLEDVNKERKREMMNLSLNSFNTKQLLKELKKDLEDSINSKTENKNLKQLIYKINHNLEFDDEWENLKKYFNEVHKGYVDRLVAEHPSLTDVELRHCIFIKLHMQTKEIANILHIDARSVQAARYRIKKKMQLSEDVDLKDYIINL